MEITLSERKFAALIRELENIPDATLSEILHNINRHAGRLFVHCNEYGVRMVGLLNQSGDLATYRFELKPSHTEADRQNRIAGLELLRPVSVSVNAADLPALILNNLAYGAILNTWPEVQSQFQRILPSEILPLLEQAASYAMNSQNAVPFDEESYQRWLVEFGLKDAMATHHERQAYREQQEEEYRQQQLAQEERFFGNENEGTFHVREL